MEEKTPLDFFKADEQKTKFKKLRLIFATLLTVALLAGLILPSLAAIEIIAFDALAIALITLPFVIAFGLITKSVHKKYLEHTTILNKNSNTSTDDDSKIIEKIKEWSYQTNPTISKQSFYIEKIANINGEVYPSQAHAFKAYKEIKKKIKGLNITSDSIEEYIYKHNNT